MAEIEFSTPSATEIKFVWRFAASQERLWAVWTQAQHLRHWWGPSGWSTPVCEVDFRPGGRWRYCMEGEIEPGNIMRSWGLGVYEEIEVPNRFTYVDTFTDEAGNQLPDLPPGHISVEFAEDNGATSVSSVTRYATQAQRDFIIDMQVEAGIRQTLDKLEAYLATLD